MLEYQHIDVKTKLEIKLLEKCKTLIPAFREM